MILRQNSTQRIYWITAFFLSATVHIFAFISFFDLLQIGKMQVAAPLTIPDIMISTGIIDNTETGRGDNQADSVISDADQENMPAAETLPQIAPKPDILSPTDPEAGDALNFDPIQSVAPTEFTHLSPIRPDNEAALLGAAPAPVAPERLTALPIKPQETSAMAPATIAPINALTLSQPGSSQSTVSNPEPEDKALNQIVKDIRDRLGDPCLIAIPQRNNTGDLMVLVVADNDRVINAFTDAVLDNRPVPLGHRSVLIDSRQCPALNIVRENANYPLFGLSLNLRSSIVRSGGHLVGTIENIAGMYTSLLLIDDNGVVQDLRRFTSFFAGRAEFDVPVSRLGAARDTSQILLVISTPGRPTTIALRAGHLANDFFKKLKSELGGSFKLALVPFEVR